MNDFPFSDYVPPKDVKEFKFSIRQDIEDHMRLLWWARHHGSDETRRRAPAARFAIRTFLDSQGVPSANQIMDTMKNHGQPRRRAVDLFMDQLGIPSAEELKRQHQLRAVG